MLKRVFAIITIIVLVALFVFIMTLGIINTDESRKLIIPMLYIVTIVSLALYFILRLSRFITNKKKDNDK